MSEVLAALARLAIVWMLIWIREDIKLIREEIKGLRR